MPSYFYGEGDLIHLSPQELLRERRIVTIFGPIDDAMSYQTTTNLMVLEEESHAPINIIINSPGGSVSAGLAIIDSMHAMKCEVCTRATGLAASMAAIILACGTRGKRTATPNTDIMIHQPLQNGLGGQASDIAIAADALIKKRAQLNNLLAQATRKDIAEIEQATDRNKWLTASEAADFGLIDYVYAHTQ